jgi:hypothetical protein
MTTEGSRSLGTWLLVGLLCVPILFCWFLLRRGYPASLRRTVFSYAGIMTLVPLIGRWGAW